MFFVENSNNRNFHSLKQFQIAMHSSYHKRFHLFYRWSTRTFHQLKKVYDINSIYYIFKQFYYYYLLIKIGTDSRVGFGYRLGEHADFQVMFELGPQTNTRPIGKTSFHFD